MPSGTEPAPDELAAAVEPPGEAPGGPGPSRWHPLALGAVLAGWLWLTTAHAPVPLAVSAVPGLLLCGAGVGASLWPGDPRAGYWMALGGLLGALLAPWAAFWLGWYAALLFIASLAAFFFAGRMAVEAMGLDGAFDTDLPAAEARLGVYAKAAVDQALLAWFTARARVPSRDAARSLALRARQLDEWLEARLPGPSRTDDGGPAAGPALQGAVAEADLTPADLAAGTLGPGRDDAATAEAPRPAAPADEVTPTAGAGLASASVASLAGAGLAGPEATLALPTLPPGEPVGATAAGEEVARAPAPSAAPATETAAEFAYHRAPPPPVDATLTPARALGQDFEWLRFTSGYAPPAGLPTAADPWLDFPAREVAHARIVRRADTQGRPWLVCCHGYRMGPNLMDLGLFPPSWYAGRLKLNLAMPILPLHGPRRHPGTASGDGFLDGDITRLLSVLAQGLWDIRRTVAWIRQQEPEARIGLLGYSLGGYMASLVAEHEPGLDLAIAVIPAQDFARLLWHNMPGAHRAWFQARGLDEARLRRLLRPVSPRQRPPLLPRERLAIFAGAADALVPPAQPLMLARHWGVPVHWYQGSHLSVRYQGLGRLMVAQMRRSGWLDARPSGAAGAGESEGGSGRP